MNTESENLDPIRQKPDFEKIADLIRNGITFSGQVGDYVIHGAIESILEDRDKFAIGFAKFCDETGYSPSARNLEKYKKVEKENVN